MAALGRVFGVGFAWVVWDVVRFKRLEALVVFGCGDVGRLRGPAAQGRELEHLIEPYAQHLDASSSTRATRPFLQSLVRPWGLRPPMRAAGCTGQSRSGGDHGHGANVGRSSKVGPGMIADADSPPFDKGC